MDRECVHSVVERYEGDKESMHNLIDEIFDVMEQMAKYDDKPHVHRNDDETKTAKQSKEQQ